jgi:hypothetical protein
VTTRYTLKIKRGFEVQWGANNKLANKVVLKAEH